MPALRTWARKRGQDAAYLQTLPNANLVASIVNGGRLYDDWQIHSGGPGQALPHPAYPPKAYYANSPAMTWRCKECHGWDYKGSQGEYASGIHATGIKGIRAMAGIDPDQIATVLRNGTHLYGAVLKYRDLLDLANFVGQDEPTWTPRSIPAPSFAWRYRPQCAALPSHLRRLPRPRRPLHGQAHPQP